MNKNIDTIGKYKYLPSLLRRVRWVQRLAAILAEALILIAFLTSGMDSSLNGVMANNSVIRWAWAAIFSLGVDTSFVISWVRCRQLGRSWHLVWSIPLALGISFVVFEPVIIQLYQQALDVGFHEALNALGISLPILVYARAGVAVALGAILALTNGESEAADTTESEMTQPKRRRLWFIKPSIQTVPAIDSGQPAMPELTPPASESEADTEQVVTAEVPPLKQVIALQQPAEGPAQPEIFTTTTPEQRAQKVSELDLTSLSASERVAKILELFPDMSDRELGKLSGMAPATAKKHRDALKSTSPVDVQTTEEGSQ